jgi:hypothetical protein
MSDETFMAETTSPVVHADIHLVANQDEGEVHFWLIERDSRFELFVSGADGQGVRMCTFDENVPFDVAASTIIALMLSYPVGGSERGMAFLDTNFGVPTGPDLLIPDFSIVEASS